MENVCPGQICRLAEPLNGRTKLLRFWINGDDLEQCYELYINPNSLRTWNAILAYLTSIMTPSFGAIRKVMCYGSKEYVTSFDDFVPGEKYIVMGTYCKVKKVTHDYMTPSEFEFYWIKKNPVQRFYSGEFMSRKTADFLRNTMMNRRTVIYVLVNGVVHQQPTKIVLCPNDMIEWDITLKFLSEKLDIPDGIEFLCTIFGETVLSPYELQHGYAYVAVSFLETFKPMDYISLVRNHKSACILQIRSSTTNTALSKHSKLTLNVRKGAWRKRFKKGATRSSSRPSSGTGKRNSAECSKPCRSKEIQLVDEGRLNDMQLSRSWMTGENSHKVSSDKEQLLEGNLDEENSILEQASQEILDGDFIKVGSKMFKRSKVPCASCLQAENLVCLHYIGTDAENPLTCCLNQGIDRNLLAQIQNSTEARRSYISSANKSFQRKPATSLQERGGNRGSTGEDRYRNSTDSNRADSYAYPTGTFSTPKMKNKVSRNIDMRKGKSQKSDSGCPPDCIYVQKGTRKKEKGKRYSAQPKTSQYLKQEKSDNRSVCPLACPIELCSGKGNTSKVISTAIPPSSENTRTTLPAEPDSSNNKVTRISINSTTTSESVNINRASKKYSRPSSASSRDSSSSKPRASRLTRNASVDRKSSTAKKTGASIVKSGIRKSSVGRAERTFSIERSPREAKQEQDISKRSSSIRSQDVENSPLKGCRESKMSKRSSRKEQFFGGNAQLEKNKSLTEPDHIIVNRDSRRPTPASSRESSAIRNQETITPKSEYRDTQTSSHVVFVDAGCCNMCLPKTADASQDATSMASRSISQALEKSHTTESVASGGHVSQGKEISVASTSARRFESVSSAAQPDKSVDMGIIAKASIKSAFTQDAISSGGYRQSSDALCNELDGVCIDRRSKYDQAEQYIANVSFTSNTQRRASKYPRPSVKKPSLKLSLAEPKSTADAMVPDVGAQETQTDKAKLSMSSSKPKRASSMTPSMTENKLTTTDQPMKPSEDKQNMTEIGSNISVDNVSMTDGEIKSTVEKATLNTGSDKKIGTSALTWETASIKVQNQPQRDEKSIGTEFAISEVDRGITTIDRESFESATTVEATLEDLRISLVDRLEQRLMDLSSKRSTHIDNSTAAGAAISEERASWSMRKENVPKRISALSKRDVESVNIGKVSFVQPTKDASENVRESIDKKSVISATTNSGFTNEIPKKTSMASSKEQSLQTKKLENLEIPKKRSITSSKEQCLHAKKLDSLEIPKKTSMASSKEQSLQTRKLDNLEIPKKTSMASSKEQSLQAEKLDNLEIPKKTSMAFSKEQSLQAENLDSPPTDTEEKSTASKQKCLKEIKVKNRTDIHVISGSSSEHFFTFTCNKCFKRTGSSSSLQIVPCDDNEQEAEQGIIIYEEENRQNVLDKPQNGETDQRSGMKDGNTSAAFHSNLPITRSVGSVTETSQTGAPDPKGRGDEMKDLMAKIIGFE